MISYSSQNSNKINTEKKSKNDESLMHLLKEHLTNEMNSAIFISIETPHLILKSFLIIFIIVAYGLAAYTTIELILTYLQYDVTTSSRTIYETPSTFPKVTFCNLSPFTTRSGFENYVNQVYTDSQLKNLSYNLKFFSALTARVYAFERVLNSSDLAKKSISHRLEDVLIGCKFNYQPCTLADFTWEFDNFYGNCFSFNTGFNSSGHAVDLAVSNLAGFSYGLQLDLYVSYYENLTLFNSVFGGTGIIIRIDNQTNVIDYAAEGILASAGLVTNLALSRESKFLGKKPYSNCILDNDAYTKFDSDIYRAILESNFSYSQQFCLTQCFQKLTINECGCYSSFFSSVFVNANKCPLSLYTCNQNAYWYIYSNVDYVNNVCLPLCPLECNSTKFTYTTSMSKLLGNPYVDIIQNNPNLAIDFVTRPINANTVGESIAKVNIFYDSLSYVNSEETPALDIITLIATMGGNWGLFLSVGLFSFAEVITTLIELYYYKKDVKI
jgi:hypothetical protein